MPAAKTLKRYGLITVACALYALGFNWFFVPNHFTVAASPALPRSSITSCPCCRWVPSPWC